MEQERQDVEGSEERGEMLLGKANTQTIERKHLTVRTLRNTNVSTLILAQIPQHIQVDHSQSLE